MKKILLLMLLPLMVLSTAACSAFDNPNPDYCETGGQEGVYKCVKTWSTMFDTTISLTLYVDKTDTYDIVNIYEAVTTLLWDYHRLFDKYNPYDGINNVFSINQNNAGTTVLDPRLFDAIAYVLDNERDISIEGEKLFNIALNPVLKIWHDARENDACEDGLILVCPVPSAASLEADFNINPDDIVLNATEKSIKFNQPDMSIDLGGFGKGYVSEVVTDYLDSLNVRYILNAGNSNVKAGGINPNNTDGFYYIALIEPTLEYTVTNTYYVYLKVSGGESVVTSGNYQRFFRGASDNLVYHHIIDPRTFYPGGEAMSVTIITEDGALADIYSTAVFLMTISEGRAFVDATEGLEAIWYKSDGTVEYSAGFETYIYQLFPGK